MKSYLALPALLLSLPFGSASASAQAMKIGTVEMKKVFESYYKTKDAETRINEARANAKKELDERMDLYTKGLQEVKKLNEDIDKPELSKEAKDKKSKERDDKVAELKTMEREINEFRVTREKQLQEQAVRMRGGLVDEINKVVAELVKGAGYQLVLDRSGPSLNGVPVVLYAQDSYDFTTEVVTALNKNRGADSAKPAEAAPAAKAADKKAR